MQLLGADADGVELGQEIERGELLDGVGENVNADADLSDLGGLFENDAFDATPMKHERQRQPADASARNEHFHGVRSFTLGASSLRLFGRRQEVDFVLR